MSSFWKHALANYMDKVLDFVFGGLADRALDVVEWLHQRGYIGSSDGDHPFGG